MKNSETNLPFGCCALVFPWFFSGRSTFFGHKKHGQFWSCFCSFLFPFSPFFASKWHGAAPQNCCCLAFQEGKNVGRKRGICQNKLNNLWPRIGPQKNEKIRTWPKTDHSRIFLYFFVFFLVFPAGGGGLFHSSCISGIHWVIVLYARPAGWQDMCTMHMPPPGRAGCPDRARSCFMLAAAS